MPATKKEPDGLSYGPASYLVVEDPDKATTFHLRFESGDPPKPDHRLMGACHAALMSPQGFRGQPYTGPGKEQAISKLKALYKAEGMDWPEDAAKMSDDRQGRLSQAKDEIAAVLNHFLDSVLPGTADHSVSFAGELEGSPAPPSRVPVGSPAEDMVIRTGKLFEVGDYPDKAFTFSEADLERAVANFEGPVPLDIGDAHIPTVLEGKMGHVQRLFAGRNGKDVLAEIHLPRWLDNLLSDAERKVSAEWWRAGKGLKRVCIVKNPRVTDAAIFAAFAAAMPEVAAGGNSPDAPRHGDGKYKRMDTPDGQAALQAHHDMTVAKGANCPDVPASMASTHENKALQAIHDIAHEHLAQISPDRMVGYSTAPIGGPVGQPQKPTSKRGSRMNIREWLTGKAKEEGVELSDLEAAFSGPDPDVQKKLDEQAQKIAAQDEENKRLSAAFATQQAEKRQADSVTFAQGYVTAHKVPPTAVEKIAALAAHIATTDTTVTFAEGQKSGSELLKDALDALRDYTVFTTEHIQPGKAAVLFNQETTEGLDGKQAPNQDRIDKMLDATPLGRQVKAAKQNGS